MTPTQRREVQTLIDFYNERKWDWGDVLEFLVRKHNGTLEIQWRYWNVPTGYKPRGRPRAKRE